MQFLVVTSLKLEAPNSVPSDTFHQLIEEETAQTRREYLAGSLRQIWLRTEGQGAIAIVEADSLKAAQALIEAFPLFKADMVDAEIISLSPYSGFGPV